jgi:hypothetical protein
MTLHEGLLDPLQAVVLGETMVHEGTHAQQTAEHGKNDPYSLESEYEAFYAEKVFSGEANGELWPRAKIVQVVWDAYGPAGRNLSLRGKAFVALKDFGEVLNIARRDYRTPRQIGLRYRSAYTRHIILSEGDPDREKPKRDDSLQWDYSGSDYSRP